MGPPQFLKLRADHRWKAKPGYAICVLDRGAVRFDYPKDWVMKWDPDSMKIHDRQPPNDNCTLAVSYLRLPPIDWSGLPLGQLLEAAVGDDHREVLERKPAVVERRNDLELAWSEARVMDAQEKRESASWLCMARGFGIQALVTFDFWVDHATLMKPVWDHVLRSLVLGWFVEDPTRGPVAQ